MKADLTTLFRLVGLPKPKTEFRFHPSRRWRFDFAFSQIMLAVEREGGTWGRSRHTTGKGYAADCAKYNEAQILGWRVLRFTVDMIRDGRALDQLQRAVEAIQ